MQITSHHLFLSSAAGRQSLLFSAIEVGHLSRRTKIWLNVPLIDCASSAGCQTGRRIEL